jgi:acyl-coenzyme A thioesterase PaaI-like protein
LKRSVTSHKNSRPFSRQLQQLRHSRLAGNDEKNSCPMSPEIPEASVYYNLENTAYNMDEEFQQISSRGFMQHNGGLHFRKISEAEYQFKAQIQDIHLNLGGSTHGGFIMSLLDSGMGTAAHRVLGPQARAATISLDVKFISGSGTGDMLMGTAKILKKTRSLVFVQGEVRCGEKLISTAEGIWKVI